jgi:hypothetical protein
MGNAKLLKRYATINLKHILENHGWQSVPSEHITFTMWRNPKKPGHTLFLYEDGEWHLLNRHRTVVNSGSDTDTLISWLTGDVKPVDHLG